MVVGLSEYLDKRTDDDYTNLYRSTSITGICQNLNNLKNSHRSNRHKDIEMVLKSETGPFEYANNIKDSDDIKLSPCSRSLRKGQHYVCHWYCIKQ